jgi:hypothetical protein
VFEVVNTGSARPVPPLHPRADAAHFASDVFRVRAAVDGTGWTAAVRNALSAPAVGDTSRIVVLLRRTAGAAPTARVTLSVTSESDASAVDSATVSVRR